MKHLYYLASPISHDEASVVQQRLEAVVMLQGQLLLAGVLAYCPHAHWNQAVAAVGTPSDWCFWKHPSFGMLDRCGALIVYRLPGWARSVGVQEELAYAMRFEKPVYFCEQQQEVMLIEKLAQLEK